MKGRCFAVITAISVLMPIIFSVSQAAAGQKTYKNSIGMEFVLIPAGTFIMGGHEPGDSHPRHKVEISKAFYIGMYEVTQEQWMAVMGSNPSDFQSPERPVEGVSWNNVQEFIRKLNQMENTDRYRLPSEAEWEYAARAGSDAAYCYGDDPDAEHLHKYAWYKKNSPGKTEPVGKLKPNVWGLYDMHGNVWEWCQDRYDKKYYANSPSTDPKGPSSGRERVLRGGSWADPATGCQSWLRACLSPGYLNDITGFRLVFSADSVEK